MLSRWRRQSDAGVTLIELVVGMTLMSIVGAIALNFFLGTTTQSNRVAEQSLVGASARAAMTQIAQTLQVADSPTAAGSSVGRFVTITPTDLAFYSNISASSRAATASRTVPSEVEFTLTNGTLWESITPAGTNQPSKNVLVSGVSNTAVFSYCSDATDPSVSCTTTANAASVAMVQVTITVQGLRGTTPQTVQSGIAIDGGVA